jgi:ribonuclease P protein component
VGRALLTLGTGSPGWGSWWARRLRHLVRERLEALPAGGIVVVRALPASADAGYGDLARDLDTALRRLRGSDASGVER